MKVISSFLVLVLISTFSLTAEAITEVKVCVWNVQNFGKTDRFVNGKSEKDAMKPESEIESMLAILARINPDILGVSEILQAPDDLYLNMLKTKLAASGLDYPYMTTVVGGDSRIQNALFSRFPFALEENLNTETFTVTKKDSKTKEVTKTEMRVGRGIVNVVIQVTPNFKLRTMVVHLKSKRPFPEVETTGDETGEGFVRRSEAVILKNAMNRILAANPDEPLIAMGDFNDEIRSRAIQTVVGPKDATVRIYDLWLTDYFGDWWTHFFFPEKSYSRIDYMFVSQPLLSRLIKEKSYVYRVNQNDPPKYNSVNSSDHRPLVAVFNVEDKKAQAVPSPATP